MTRFTCECGHISDTAHVSGYDIGDTLLEGVMFVVKDNGKGKLICQGVIADAEDYMKKLNLKKWVKECTQYCNDDPGSIICEKCQENM